MVNPDLVIDQVMEPCFVQDDLVRVLLPFPADRDTCVRAGPFVPFIKNARDLSLEFLGDLLSLLLHTSPLGPLRARQA